MCGSADFEVLGMRLSTSQGSRPREAEGIAVSVKRCRQCGLIFSDPLPKPRDISDHYGLPPQSYWSDPSHWCWTPAYFANEIAEAKRLLGFTPGMTALDVGAGLGKAMRSLVHAGFDTWGIEPLAHFRDKAIEVSGIRPDRLQVSSIEQAEYPARQFDFITFGAVLEHLYSPSLALARALSWLKPGGIIQAEVPSSDWLIAKLVNLYFRVRRTNYVTHISPMHPPFHLYEFTPESFRRNGLSLGYEIAGQRTAVCSIVHVPGPLQPFLRWWMQRTGTGMQLTVYLRKSSSALRRDQPVRP